MNETGEFRGWEEMIPDDLGQIFRNLSLQEILTVVPRVCKSWHRAVSGPYCWQEIDIREWSRRCKPEHVDRMLQMLITRSSGSLLKLRVSGLSNDPIFRFIAEHAGSLQSLQLPRSEISDCIVEQVAWRLSNVTFLDVSYCMDIGARALEAFGKNCKSLVGLIRGMHLLEAVDKSCQDDEAHAIACSMPKLKHLEMFFCELTTGGVIEILSGCRDLEFLDIRGCMDVKLDEKLLKDKYAGLKVRGPLFARCCFERNFWEDCWDYFMDDYEDYLNDDDDDERIQ